ncbi:GtrA family protein [Synechococcus sp. BSF8S]|nr:MULTISPECIES: GtrA family protein [unclassified Synechococcus]MBC1260087.1 GtrA family protein [Synechococcus sp. BSF8S]MBC1263096.1 GtrA family protein [Synechococcus sp. BSA11S]
MRSTERIIRFGGVGIAATSIHYFFLYSLSLYSQNLSAVNVISFLIATGFSFVMQQRFTFRDRLRGKKLNGYALFSLILINSAINWLGGILALENLWLKPALPLLAAGANFCTYGIMVSRPFFHRMR